MEANHERQLEALVKREAELSEKEAYFIEQSKKTVSELKQQNSQIIRDRQKIEEERANLIEVAQIQHQTASALSKEKQELQKLRCIKSNKNSENVRFENSCGFYYENLFEKTSVSDIQTRPKVFGRANDDLIAENQKVITSFITRTINIFLHVPKKYGY